MSLPDEYFELASKVNNWGRWGDDDQRGTLNFITPERIVKAAQLVKQGKAISLSLALSENGPQTGALRGRINPIKTMVAINEPLSADPEGPAMSDDLVVLSPQGATHWDALAHVSRNGLLYNGFEASTINTSGAHKLGIHKTGPIVGRGILLDVARTAGVDRLSGGHALTSDDLDAASTWGGIKPTSGDIVLVRTGHISLLHQGDKDGYIFTSPGLSMKTAEWFHDNEIAAVATDTIALEVYPCEREDLMLPVHMLHLVEMGLTQGQNFDLEALALDCAQDRTYEFFLEATPEPLVRGLGSMVNAIAIK